MSYLRRAIARDPSESHRAATQLELFFDLVSVIAIASATASYHHAISYGHGADQWVNFLFAFIAIWWAWMNYTWFATAFDNDDAIHRILTIVIMAGSLMFGASINASFEAFGGLFGVLGWVVMRVGMIGLWLRVASHDPTYRARAMRHAIGIGFAQVLWVALYVVRPEPQIMILAALAVFAIEFLVPVWATRVGPLPWHRHHIIERYGLLNIIVMGETLLSVSFVFAQLQSGEYTLPLVLTAVSGLVIVFVLWWIYFMESEHLNTTDLPRTFLWGYGHIGIFFSGALLAAGLAAHLDVLTDHSKITSAQASRYIAIAVALFLGTLWLIRDAFELCPKVGDGVIRRLG